MECVLCMYMYTDFHSLAQKHIILLKLWKNVLVLGNALQLKTFELFGKEEDLYFFDECGHMVSHAFFMKWQIVNRFL